MKNLFFLILYTCTSIFSFSQDYTPSKSLNTSSEYITNVHLENINNTSDGGDSDIDPDLIAGYDDFTSLDAAKLVSGSTYTLSVTIKHYGNNHITAWIDWNDDGDFTDAGEKYIIVSGVSTPGPHSVDIPVLIVDRSSLRMRVSLGWQNAPASTGDIDYGEVEDYSIFVDSDADGDGVGDFADLDDDNDGILDADEIACLRVETDVFSVKDGVSKTFDLPSAKDGFTILVSSFDNSFNMIINGVNLVPKQLQFQSGSTSYLTGDSFVRFASDGTAYGESGNLQAWAINNKNVDPSIVLLRIIIAADGSVSFQGIRSVGSPLEDLIIKAGDPPFNTITWNAVGKNVVEVTQRVTGPTYLYATGYGYDCSGDADNDNIINSLDNDSDNDGCPDAIEGGGTYTNADIDESGMLTANVDVDGVPAGRSQSHGVSKNMGSDACSVTFPVSLIGFNATKNESIVDLSWSTASEINNDYFLVQKSTDNVNFETIESVEGNGNSNVVINYSTVDNYPSSGVNYYRLQQVDFDGTQTYTSTVAVNFIGENEIIVYPNPTTGIVNIDGANDFQLMVYHPTGKSLFNTKIDNTDLYNLDLSNFSKGVYIIHLISNSKTEVRRVIVQ